MNSDLSLLISVLNLDTMDMIRIAIKIPNGKEEFPDWKDFKKLDVHDKYRNYLPDIGLGEGCGIIEVSEIYDVVYENEAWASLQI